MEHQADELSHPVVETLSSRGRAAVSNPRSSTDATPPSSPSCRQSITVDPEPITPRKVPPPPRRDTPPSPTLHPHPPPTLLVDRRTPPFPPAFVVPPISPGPALPAPQSSPRLQILRTSNTSIHPGSSFPISIRFFNLFPSPYRPFLVRLTFSARSAVKHASSLSAEEHALFRLEAPLPLVGPVWTGTVTVPETVRCATCGTSAATAWTFEHTDEASGRSWRTSFRSEVEAEDGSAQAELKVEVLPDLALPSPGAWRMLRKAEMAVAGQLDGFELEDVEASFRPSVLPVGLPVTASTDVPLAVEASLLFRPSDTASPDTFSQLLSTLSPSSSVFTLSAVLRTADGSVIPLGGSWSSSSSLEGFALAVEAVDDGDRSQKLRVKLRLVVLTKAIIFASSTSCAGFSVGFHLDLDFDTWPGVPPTLRISLPFHRPAPLRATSAPPPAASAFSAPSSITDVGRTGAGAAGGKANRWRKLKKRGRAWRRRLFSLFL